MKLQVFNGGQSSRLKAHLIGVNEAEQYLNIDNESGSLEAVNKKLASSISVEEYAHYYIEKNEWVSSSINRDYVEYQRKLYWTEDNATPKKYDGNIVRNLGITQPAVAPIITGSDDSPDAPTGVTLSLSATGGDLPLLTLMEYIFVNVAIDTLESPTFAQSITTSGTVTNKINISALVDGDNSTEVYRKYNSTYHYIGTLSATITSIDDDTFDIFSGEKFDLASTVHIDGTVQYLYTYYNSTDGTESASSAISEEQKVSNGQVTLANLVNSPDPQVDKKRLYRVGGDLTTFTLVVTLDASVTAYTDKLSNLSIDGSLLTSSSYQAAPLGLKYLTEAYGMLFGVLGDKLYFTPVGLPNAWPSLYTIDFDLGCTGIGVVVNGLVVCTKYKSYLITGNTPATLSKAPLSNDQGCIEHKTIQGVGQNIIWQSTDGLCTTNGSKVVVVSKDKLAKFTSIPANAVVFDEVYYLQDTSGTILALDSRYGQIYKSLSLGTTRLVTADDVLYGYSEGQLFRLFADIANKESFTYKSPIFIEASYSMRKGYKNFYMRSEGQITVEIFIDDVSIYNRSFTTKDTHELKIPQNKQNGYSVQFLITGTGIVYELEGKALGRQTD